MATYHLKVLNQDRTFYEGEVSSSVLPGGKGSFGVLAHHVSLVSTLEPGPLFFTESSGKSHRYRISAGLVETRANQTTLYLDSPPQTT